MAIEPARSVSTDTSVATGVAAVFLNIGALVAIAGIGAAHQELFAQGTLSLLISVLTAGLLIGVPIGTVVALRPAARVAMISGLLLIPVAIRAVQAETLLRFGHPDERPATLLMIGALVLVTASATTLRRPA